MKLLSDLLRKKRGDAGTAAPEPGNKTASGKTQDTTAIATALGTLLTGQTNIDDPSKLIAQIKGKGAPKPENVGLLGILMKMSNNIGYIVGDKNKDFFKNYWEVANENQKFLKENVLNTEFVNTIKDIPNLLKRANSSLDVIVETLKNKDSIEGGEGREETHVEVKGGNDFALILTAVKNFDIEENAKKSLETLSKMTSPGGTIDEIFTNIETLNNKNVDVNKFVEQLTKINEVSSESAAIEGKVNAQKIENSVKVMESVSRLMSSLIGVSILLVVVGLLSSKIDFVGILKFSGVLLLFLTGIMTVYVLASIALRTDGPVFKGMENFTNLVAVSAAIMLFGALVTRWISISDLTLFTTMLSVFLWGIMGIISNFADVFNKENLGKTLNTIPAIIITCTVVMLLGSFAIEYIDIGNLIKFTFTLGIFLFTILSILAIVVKMWGEHGAKGMKTALLIIVGSSFLMFLGAAVIPALNIKNLALFTLTLGVFLLVTLSILAFVAWLWKKSGAKDMGTAMLVVVGAAFLMFLGAAVYSNIDKVALLLFTLTLSGFLVAIILPFKLVSKDLNKAEKVLLRMIIFVGLSATILMIGGFLFMKYPKLKETVPLFGFILGLFILAMSGIILLLSTIKSANLTKATLALMGISGCLVIISGAFLILTEVGKRIDGIGGMIKFTLLVYGAMKVLGVLTAGIVALAFELGNGVTTTMAYLAIGVVLAAASAFAIVAVGFLGIAAALEKLSQIKSFDVSPLIEGVGSLTLLMYAMAPLIPMAPFLLMVEAVMFNLTLIISKMAETVKDYADLKIAVYEGTKVVGYRHLDTSDFQSASDNISLIVTTLTEGIMKAYEAHPEWYGSNVSPLWALAGPWGLIGAAIQGSQKSPLERVIAQSKLLAPLIAQIADAVKDYADLKVKIYEGTKHVGYRHLEKSDFANAATNISLLVNVLTEGVMKAYEAHSEWYGGGVSPLWGLCALAGPVGLAVGSMGALIQGTQKSPLERVIAQSKLLGPLISQIGKAVGDIANLKMATKWDKNGNATDYKVLNEQDFKNAAKNVSKVITVLTKSIMNVYEDHEDWYKDGWFSDSPIINVINTNKKLSELISDVASSIKDYADLKMPVDWVDGKPSNFKSMKDEDFKNAGANVGLVLNTLGLSLMYIYKEHEDWYKDGWVDDSPFVTVIETNTKLSKLISSVAAGVKDYADLRMPDYDAEWKDGKPTKYTKMEPSDFAEAGLSIGLVVTTTAMGLMGYVPKINDDKLEWVEGPAKNIIDEYILSDNDDKYEAFNRVLDASVKIGTVVSSLADGISNFSKMMFPDYSGGIDDEGRPKKGYKELKSTDFEAASKCITTVITTVADALIEVVNKDKRLPEGQRMWNIDDDFEESPLFKILSASEKMGQGITNIASGLAEYANMKFATGYDKDGKATGYQRLSEGDLKKASEKITDVITLISGTMMGIYKAGKDSNSGKNIWDIETNWFGQPKGELSSIERVINASSVMASMIESMAKGIAAFAGGNMGSEENPIIITTETLNLAKLSVTDVLKNTAETIAGLANNEPTKSMFENDNLKLILDSLSHMTAVIAGTATGIQMFAALSIPTKWDENGKPTEFNKMSEPDFTEASKNIKTVIVTIGQAFNDVINDAQNSWLQDIDDSSFAGISNFAAGIFNKKKSTSSSTIAVVMNAIMKMAFTLSIMSGCIYGYATMRFPKGVNDQGHMEYSEQLSLTDIDNAKTNIVKVITSLGLAMMEAVNNPVFLLMSGEEGQGQLEKLGDYTSSITETIVDISDSVKEMTESESMKNLSTIVENLGNSKTTIENLINKIGELVTLIFDKGSGIYSTSSFADLVNKYKDKYETTSNSFENFTNSIMKIIESLGNMNKPLNESYVKINSLYNLFENERYVDKIRSIISNIGFMLRDMRKISQFDNLFVNEETGMAGFADDVVDFFVGTNQSRAEANREKAQEEINSIVEKLAIYSNLILNITDTLKKINNNVSNVKMANYIEFNNSITGFFNAIKLVKSSMADITKEDAESISIIIKSYSSALDSLIITSSHTNGLKNFGGHVNQLDKFVKSVNSIKLLNLNQMNKFVTSLNQLANKMGNLDRLTEAISNKLSKVLEKLVERLVHAEQTIVKADEIQKRRHELIKKSVEEVSNLMKQPMTIEVQATSNSTTAEESPTDTTKTT